MSYVFYGYVAYKMYEYASLLDYAIFIGRGVGRGVRRVGELYSWMSAPSQPTIPPDTQTPQSQSSDRSYLDWVLIKEEKNSPLLEE